MALNLDNQFLKITDFEMISCEEIDEEFDRYIIIFKDNNTIRLLNLYDGYILSAINLLNKTDNKKLDKHLKIFIIKEINEQIKTEQHKEFIETYVKEFIEEI